MAAVIERNGDVLICQRKRGGRHGLKWEFPGGKVEPDEEPRDALARELREELAIEASVGPLLGRHQTSYPDGAPIHLHFYHVTEFTGQPVNLEFEWIVWEPREKLPEYDFLEGDVEFVARLARGEV